METERKRQGNVTAKERRVQPRRPASTRTAVLLLDSGQSVEGRVVDESLGGIGLEFEQGLPFEPALNQQLAIAYNGIRLAATMRHLRRSPAGGCRIGVQWDAAGFAQMQAGESEDESSEFFQIAPSGLFVMSEFIENKKWEELAAAAIRLQEFASRCGITQLDKSVSDLVDTAERPSEQASIRKSFHCVIEQCVELREYRVDENESDSPVPPQGDVSLVDSLLQTIEKTENKTTIRSLADVLRGLMSNISPDVIELVFGRIADARDASGSAIAVEALSGTLTATAARLQVESVEPAFQRVSTMLASEKDPRSAKSLQNVLKTLAEKLPPEASERIFDQMLTRISRGTEEQAEPLVAVLQTVGERLPIDAVERVAPRVIKVVAGINHPAVLPPLRHVVQLLTDRLPLDCIGTTFHQLVAALERTEDDLAMQCLAEVLCSVTERMPVGENLFG